uniref:Transcriptional activator protein n=1 Tax=Sweet potato leaf curl virus TaxID=100755 RepID=A0A0P0ITG8_9GEMI|nr:transactivator protein [Sweet potato leaf curl virus]
MSNLPSGIKRKCPIQEPLHAEAKKAKRKVPETRTRIVWKGCGCSAFITQTCKYQHGFTHRGITKSCSDYESTRIRHQPHVCGSDCTILPETNIRPPECTGENSHQIPDEGQLQGENSYGIPQDIPAIQDSDDPANWCYSQLDWYFGTP